MPTGPTQRDIGLLDAVTGAIADAVLVVDAAGRLVFLNEAARHLPGDPDGLATGRLLADAVAPSHRDALRDVTDRVLAGEDWRGELLLDAADGRPMGVLVACSAVRDGDQAGEQADDQAGRLALVLAEGGAVRSRVHVARRLAERLSGLARVAAELAGAEDLQTVTEIVTSEGAHAVGATVGSLSLLDGDSLQLLGIHGGLPGAEARWRSFPVADRTPAGDVVRSGERLVLLGRAAIDERYPDMERAAGGERSMVVLPLQVSGRTVGVMSWSFPGRRRLDAAEMEFYAVLADCCAQAVERIRARQDSAEQAARVRFLADATGTLAESLDYQRTLREVARMVVPGFADWCAIDLVDDGRLRRLAVEHVDPDKVELARELQERYPARPDEGGVWTVLGTAEPLLVAEVTDEMVAPTARDDEHRRLLLQLRLRSVLLVPLLARGTVLGVMTWVMAESDRRYGEADVPFAMDVARRAAIAIDNSLLHTETREAAARLQRAVLPRLPNAVPGWELAAHYAPSGRTEVGGDFFDVVPLDDDRVVIVVGDVMGRGVRAAAAMAQARAAIRAYVADDPEPEVVMAKLDRLFGLYDVERLVTLVYLLADGDSLRLVTAGHPPPVVLRRGGDAELAPSVPAHPLGVEPTERVATTFRVAEGDVLVAYTDGLVERREETIDVGLARLLSAVPALRDAPLADGVARLVAEVADRSRDDDVALLALRRVRPSQDAASATDAGLRLTPGPTALHDARVLLADRLRGWGVSEDVVLDVELVAHELLVNAEQHGSPPVDLRLHHTAAELLVEVEDRSPATPRERPVDPLGEHGRGLAVVEALTSAWGVRLLPAGKVVWARHALPPPAGRGPDDDGARRWHPADRTGRRPVRSSPSSEAGMGVTVSSDRRDDAVVVHVAGDFDLHSSPQVREAVDGLVGTDLPLYLDLSRVEFLDSSGLGTLVGIQKRATQAHQPVALCGLTPQVSRILQVTALRDVFTVLPEVPAPAPPHDQG